MTNERMDARLGEAGARWREAHDDAPADAADEVPLQPRPGGAARRTPTVLAVAAVAAVAVAAGTWVALRPGSSSPSAAAARLTGTDWILAGYTGTAARYDGSLDQLRLTISNGRILGNDGCNSFSGPVEISARTLRLHGLTSTLVGCATGHELPLDTYFAGTVRWSIAGDVLTLTKDGVGTLTYRAPVPGSRQDLVGRTWALQGIRNASGDVGWSGTTPAPPTTATTFERVTDSTLFISSAGELIADARCGEYSARVGITATKLTVSGRSYTAHRCPAPVTDDQYQPDAATAALRTVLRGTLRWSIDRGVLTIGAGNGPQLQYGPQADAPTPSATPATVPPSATATASPVGAAVLVDRTWYLAEVEQRPASDSSYSSSLAVGVGGTPPTFRIGSDGQFLAGLGTCEAYQGRARVADGTFTIASRSRSAGTCPAEPDAGAGASDPLPTLMAQVLSGTVQWQVSGDALSLSHAGNAVVLHYSDLRPSATVSPRS